MVRVYTDHPELLNDLGEVIRLYLPMEEVVPAENGEAAPLYFGCDGGKRRYVARCLYCRYGWGAGRVRLSSSERGRRRAEQEALSQALHEDIRVPRAGQGI